MKLTVPTKILIWSIIGVLSFFSCADDGPVPGCFQEENRSIVAFVTNENGTILAPTEACDIFILESENVVENQPLRELFACNISEDLKEDGIAIVFSGYVYETFEDEDICAIPFEITEIRRQ
ncbi:MAG: hypothetical protein AAGB24_14980 [Bacteroidota bacterium]